MKPKTYSEYEKEEHRRKMKEWAYLYPLTSVIMNNEKLPEEEAVRLVKLGNSRR